MSSKYNCAKAGTSFLKVHNWRDPIGGNMVKPFELEVMIVSKDLLRNVVQMLPTASPRDVWSGTNQRRASKFKQQVVFLLQWVGMPEGDDSLILEKLEPNEETQLVEAGKLLKKLSYDS